MQRTLLALSMYHNVVVGPMLAHICIHFHESPIESQGLVLPTYIHSCNSINNNIFINCFEPVRAKLASYDIFILYPYNRVLLQAIFQSVLMTC